MRFITGALCGIIVLLTGAVAYTALHPLSSAQIMAMNGADPMVPSPALADASDTSPVQTASVVSAPTAPAAGDKELADADVLDTEIPNDVVTQADIRPDTDIQTAEAPEAGPVLADPAAIVPLAAATLPSGNDHPDLSPVAWLAPVAEAAPLPPVIETAAAEPVDQVYVTGGRVNMRSGPGSRFDWLATLSRGEGLILIETQGGWSKVQAQVDGAPVTGWMASAFLGADRIDA